MLTCSYVQPVPYAIKATSPIEDVTPEASKIEDVPEPAAATEDIAPLEASAAKFPAAPTDTPTVSLSDSGQGETKPSTPLDPSFLKAFPSVPDTSNQEDPSKIDSDRVRVEVIVPPSPERTTGVQASVVETEGDAVAPLNPEAAAAEQSDPDKRASFGKKPPPKSPLLDDEDPGDFEEGWATVTK